MITITDQDQYPTTNGRDLPQVRALHEAATNTGSLLLWGSSAYPRMDRSDAVRGGTGHVLLQPQMAYIGYGVQDGRAITSGDPHPLFPGVKSWQLFNRDGSVVR